MEAFVHIGSTPLDEVVVAICMAMSLAATLAVLFGGRG